jgi:hypothetical protein
MVSKTDKTFFMEQKKILRLCSKTYEYHGKFLCASSP